MMNIEDQETPLPHLSVTIPQDFEIRRSVFDIRCYLGILI